MEYRLLGRSGLKVSVLSFGAMTFGGTGMFSRIGGTQLDEAKRQIGLCLDAGVNLFDTADVYSDGLSEETLGQALGKDRPNALIATKCFIRIGPGVNDQGASRLHIVRSCEASLRRLKTDYIDLYQIHNQDLLTPPEETMRALDDLVSAGKVRYVGSSNYAGWTKMRALGVSDRLGLTRFISQQIQYSLLRREAEDELLQLGVYEGVGGLIWSPLAAGYLSGKYKEGREITGTRIGSEDQRTRQKQEVTGKVIAAVADIAERRGVSPSQVALNWVVRRGGVSSIITGARTLEQLEDNLGAAGWSLDDEEMTSLDAASAGPPRYPYDTHRRYGDERNPVLPLLPGINQAQ